VLKIRGTSLSFLVAYFVFLPVITWWDPFEPKWFIVPNLFLAGFFATALEPWLRTRLGSGVVLGSVLFIAATNFITTIRPRHQFVGQDRLIAECVAQNMHPNDLLIAAEWGWPDYLEYLHGRMSLSLIGNAASVDGELARVHRTGGKAFMLDPETYSDAHLSWLQSQSGVSRKDLIRLADAPAFSCYGRRIFSLRE
jgi:hypothetical protein